MSVDFRTTLYGVVLPFVLATSACSRDRHVSDEVGVTDSSGRRFVQSVPLDPPSPATSRQLFERLTADQSGIEFVHRWEPPAKYAANIDRAFAGGGVAIGDYDGDGRADVYLSRPFGGGRLYRNLGQFRFQDVTKRAGMGNDTSWGAGCTMADVDGDADLDLYVCGFDCPNRLFINQGDGTFVEQSASFGLDFAGSSVMMAFADYDRDGDLDGYLLTNRPYVPPEGTVTMDELRAKLRQRGRGLVMPQEYKEYIDFAKKPDGQVILITSGQYDHLFRNNGDGTFTDVSSEAGIKGNDLGLSSTWWDYNADGFPDLYVANDFFGPDRLYRNNRDGTFTDVAKSSLPHTPWFSMGTDVADINNDGRLDLMGSDMSGTTHYKQKIGMGDMDQDGWFLEWPEPRQYMRNAVYLNSGTDRFMEVSHMTGLANSDWTWSLKFADFDNDSWTDLFITNGMTGDYLNSDLRSQANASGHTSPVPLKRDANLAFRNRGNLQFEDVSESWGLGDSTVSFGAATGDLDGDGDLDVIVNNFNEPVGVYRNQSSVKNRVKLRLKGTTSNRYGIGSQIRLETQTGVQLRYLTLSRGFMSADEPIVYFGLGDDEVIEKLRVLWPSGQQQTFEDLSANRFYTITEPQRRIREDAQRKPPDTMFVPNKTVEFIIHREREFDDFVRQPLLPNRLSRLGPGMAWGDVDGDGVDDLYLGGSAGHPGRIYRRQRNGGFDTGRRNRDGDDAAFRGDRECEDMASLLFDADGDDDLDLYVVSGGVECDAGDAQLQDRLYLNDGRGSFRPAPTGVLPDIRESGSTAAACDFDRDGDLDLFVGGRVIPGAYPETPRSYLLKNDGGRFVDATDVLAAQLRQTGLVTSAVWSDADDDGWTDLLVTHEWGPVKFYRNARGRLVDKTDDAALSGRLGWWNGIAAGDVDNDGDVDYVVTNFGLNTKYHPTAKESSLIFFGDFESKGIRSIVEAKQSAEGMLPVRGKSCSQNAMPFIRTKFPRFHDFAIAGLQEIYTAECLEKALKLEANCLQSGVLINNGSASFRFEPLPRIAQVSPGFGVVLSDFDGDGNLDLFVAHNFFGPQRETGRMDGGLSLLMRGNGDGTFSPVWPDQSGIVVAGDAKSAAAVDLNRDGWTDLVVAVNDGHLMAFENRGSKVHRMRHVVLRGAPANPTAVGARVTAHFQSGRLQTAEVFAGAGYLTQSPATLSFGSGPTDELTHVTVRWPNGSTSEHKFEATRDPVVIEQPIPRRSIRVLRS